MRYALDGMPAALGFRLPADAMRFELAPLDLGKADSRRTPHVAGLAHFRVHGRHRRGSRPWMAWPTPSSEAG